MEDNTMWAKVPVIDGTIKIGILERDAEVVDLTCSSCKGAYHSVKTTVCPKCQKPLVNITTLRGVPMSITICSFYVPYDKETQNEYDHDISIRKNYKAIAFEAKLYHYMNKGEPISAHPLNMHLKKGTRVELHTYNHPVFCFDPEKSNHVIITYVVKPERYGDSFKILSRPFTKQIVNSKGKPVPIKTDSMGATAAPGIAKKVAPKHIMEEELDINDYLDEDLGDTLEEYDLPQPSKTTSPWSK